MHLKKPSQLPPRHLQLIPLPHRHPPKNKHRYQAAPVIAKGKALKQSDCTGKACDAGLWIASALRASQ